mgnify:CR=1 FL=1
MNDSKVVCKWYRVCQQNEIPVKEGRTVHVQNNQIALFHLQDGFRAIDNICPHGQGPLADGIVAGQFVYCPMHGLKIDLDTGCTADGGQSSVKTYPVKLIEDQIYVAADDDQTSD